MPSRQRYVVGGVVSLALLLAVALGHGFQWMWVRLGIANPQLLGLKELALTNVLAGLLAAGLVAFCLKHRTTNQLATEVVEELAKVSWPSREETGYATAVVIVTVVVCSAYFGIFDTFWMWVTNWILGVNATAG